MWHCKERKCFDNSKTVMASKQLVNFVNPEFGILEIQKQLSFYAIVTSKWSM